MVKLVHGGDIYSARERIQGTILDFSANINPLGLPDSVKSALMERLDDFALYPDPLCRELVQKIAESEQIAPEHILCANGAAELIFRLVQAIRPRCALVIAPTFAEYEQALNGCSCRIEYHLLKEEQDFVLDDSVLEKIHPHTGIVFLCNPNNPTGQLVDQKLLERILVRCSSCGALLVVDECFRDFLEDCDGNSMKGWVEEFPNLLILRAFTKHFAMAGLRLGYCLCANPPLLERMAGLGQPWGVSVPAQIAGVAALSDTDYLRRTRELIAQERGYLKQQLGKLPVRVIGSQANYIFFHAPEDSERENSLAAALEQDGILIRSCDNYYGMPKGYYRIAVRSHADNQKLVEAMERFFVPPIQPAEAQTVTLTAPQPDEPKEESPSVKIEEQPAASDESGLPSDEPFVEPTSFAAEDAANQATDPAVADAVADAVAETEPPLKVPQQDRQTPPSAEQKRQYRFLRDKQKRYEWEDED